MYKATKIIALPIMDIESGRDTGCATNILFDNQGENGHLEIDKGSLVHAEVLAVKDICGAGDDYLLIKDGEALKKVRSMDDETRNILQNSYILIGAEVIEEAGTKLGKIVEVDVSNQGTLLKIFLENGMEFEKEKVLSICLDAVFVNLNEEELEDSSKEEITEVEEDIEEDIEEIASPVGLVVDEDVVSKDGIFKIDAGTVITEEIFNEALEHDALVELALCAR